MVNRNESVANIYRLHDLQKRFIGEVELLRGEYEVIDLVRLQGKYYVRRGGWQLYETICFEPEENQ